MLKFLNAALAVVLLSAFALETATAGPEKDSQQIKFRVDGDDVIINKTTFEKILQANKKLADRLSREQGYVEIYCENQQK